MFSITQQEKPRLQGVTQGRTAGGLQRPGSNPHLPDSKLSFSFSSPGEAPGEAAVAALDI